MPRRKKNGQSPARAPGGPSEAGSLVGHDAGYRPPQGHDAAMAGGFRSGDSKIVKSMQEMFSHLDPEVIYIVLSECDFKVENAMDSLLELSEVAAPIPSPPSGFERTAAALLSPRHFSEPRLDLDDSKQSQLPSSPPSSILLTEELDLLVDQELETLTAQQDVKREHHSSQYLSAGASHSSFPLPPFPQQPLPELPQSGQRPGSRGPSTEQVFPVGRLAERISGASSPFDQLSSWDSQTAEGQQSGADFTHLSTETPADKPKPPLDLAALGRPSAFQVYKKQGPSHGLSEEARVLKTDGIVGGARSKVNMLNREPPGCMSTSWNLEAPVFSPHIHGNQGPTFITPVAQTPSKWPSQSRQASPWLSYASVGRAPLKPSATIPKSWALPDAPQPPALYNRLRLEGKVLVMLRGAPGSGKSTMARALLEHNPGGVKLSTDDYFSRLGEYQFDPTVLGEAHESNHKQAKEAFERGTTPIIIDNTNMQGWEMKPYVVQALKHRYKVLFREPDTWWKNKPRELQRRTTHNVPVETIRRMLNGYERFVTVQSIMGSQVPEWKQDPLLENRNSQLVCSETPCPDLVGQPGLTEGPTKSCPELFSSLPDVSSVGHSSDVGKLEEGTHKSTESLSYQPTGRPMENPEASDGDDDMDLGELDSELNAQLQLSPSTGDQRIPDCIVESVMNEDHRGDEIPVAFTESIGQRVRRERRSKKCGDDRMEPADLVKDVNKLESEAKDKEKREEAEGVEAVRDEEEKGMPKILDFIGDWPSEGSLEQRQVRRRDRNKRNGREDEGVFQEDNENKVKVESGPQVTEFQKVLDLIQTGVDTVQTSSSCLPPLSLNFEEELLKERKAGGRFEESHGSKSYSEDREQNMSELPDCVLDWKAVDSCKVRKSRIDHWEDLKTENEASSAMGGKDHGSETGRETNNSKTPLSAITADSLVISKAAETNICPDGVGSHSIESDAGTEPGDIDSNSSTEDGRETRTEADGSHISEVCQSPVCEGSVETEGSAFSGGSQERKQRQGRRSAKQCKLALTFTQNCPGSSLNTPESPSTTAQNIDSSQSSVNTDVKPSFNPNCNTSPNLKVNLDLLTQSKSEANLQPPSPPPSLVDTGCFTQTEPQDFALLWRLNRQDSPDDTIVTTYSQSSNFSVLYGNSSRFMPELSSAVSAAFAVHPTDHKEVPYRVVHERGTQVEEKELVATQDRLESLRILSRHFKLVSFDTLEDLYDKCHQDLQWMTNLLLDSGESFFKDEDGEEGGKEEEKVAGAGAGAGAGAEDDQNTSSLCEVLGEVIESRLGPIVVDESHSEDLPKEGLAEFEERTQESASGTVGESNECSSHTDLSSFEGVASPIRKKDPPDTTSLSEKTPQMELSLPKATKERDNTEHKLLSEPDLQGGAWEASIDEKSRMETEDESSSMDEINRLLQAELEEMERERKQSKEVRTERRHMEERRSRHLDIQSVELKLPTELALQLTELFGPVGVEPGTCSTDDYAVQIDLNLAKLLHQKWKETIQERQRQENLSLHLLQKSSVHWGESQVAKPGPQNRTKPAHFLISADGYMSLDSQPEACGQVPFMDHWNVSHPHVSLRDIIKEEQALQRSIEKNRQNHADLDRRDGATLLKEEQLYSLYPTIDRHFLQDIFRNHNYSLTQTKLFLRSLLDEEPVKTVIAPEAPRCDHHRAASKEREKRQKPLESAIPDYQDVEDPQYDDFRAEASLQRSRQIESFTKAAEAFKQGHKQVASFYAQQGHMHGQRMHEANHRAAIQIFERVNSSLLPKNILDLHGLHVGEALEHLAQVLQDKTADCEQGRCRSQLSVITGRGNHSQGGLARIRPAVIEYLTNKHYRFTEPKPGLVLVSLK